ncbi:membrane-bound lytic murein transglycosylase b precursor [hydrocarbon metagenome]|uniref:Membrane-bound lytic murein transglycosylase b n=1 Tax=hydrocarbon metagenome TaxID=938273 RepID=A0A0W8G4D5_9ZZZZ
MSGPGLRRAAVFPAVLAVLAVLAMWAACAVPPAGAQTVPGAAGAAGEVGAPGAPGVASEAGAAVSFEPLIRRLVDSGRSEAAMRALFARPEMVFDPEPMSAKLTELYMSKYGLKLVADIQKRLAELGYHPWPVDGRLKRLSKWSIRAWQRHSGLPERAVATADLLAALRASTAKAPAGLSFPPIEAPSVYESALTGERLAEARVFLAANREMLARVRARYGLPEEVAVGVSAVETRCGRYLGDKPAAVSLAGMALARDYSLVARTFAHENPSPDRAAWLAQTARERGDWAYRELTALLDYAARLGRDPLAMPGSIYGAIGVSQFMPTNALTLARDGDGDGVADLFNVADALESMGNYLNKAGVGGQTSEAALREALFRYNRSRTYVNTIMAVAAHLRETAGSGASGP